MKYQNHLKFWVFGLILIEGQIATAMKSRSADQGAPVEVVEMRLQDARGLKIEIFKQADEKTSYKEPPPFPEDLTVSDKIDDKKTWFAWNPTGAYDVPLSRDCRHEVLRDSLWKNPLPVGQAEAVNEWGRRCHPQRPRGFLRDGYLSMVRFSTMKYSFWENPHIHHVKATLADGRVLDGFIAMKPGRQRRPFVIAKCGVFCNAEQSVTHRSFMMHLFDESPFHVLTLANNTGSDFQVNNKAISMGGFDEGRQLYQIAQLVRSPDSPIRDLISSVHIVGSSLGGAAALYSGLYSSLNDSSTRQNIQSVIALCPVIVLDKSLRALYQTKPISTLATFETITQIRDVFNFVPIIGNYFPANPRRMRGDEIYEKLTSATFQYYQDWTTATPWDLKPFEGVRIDTLDQLWHVNDFRNFVSQVKVPTLIVAADNDRLVRSRLNSRLLADVLRKKPNPQVGIVFLPWGSHGAFSLENGWPNYSTLLREYILTQSPESAQHWQIKNVPIPPAKLDLRDGEKVVDVVWKAVVGSDQMRLTFKITSPYGKVRSMVCTKRISYFAQKFCYRKVGFKIPLSQLPFEDSHPPRNRYEATALTRFANTRFEILDKEGRLVVNSRRSAKFVSAWVWK